MLSDSQIACPALTLTGNSQMSEFDTGMLTKQLLAAIETEIAIFCFKKQGEMVILMAKFR